MHWVGLPPARGQRQEGFRGAACRRCADCPCGHLPDTILCYNTGAYLTCQGADTLEDLRLLESEGVTILTCGTCLDFYKLKEKLAVGTVTNMYDIVERMENAAQIIKP